MDIAKRNEDFKKACEDATASPRWNCRFHPTDWWHEVGCPHQVWTKEELLDALIKTKASLMALALFPITSGEEK